MRIVLFVVYVALECRCLSAAEIDAEVAIQEAVDVLEAKLPSLKSSDDKKKVEAAIESLRSKMAKGNSTSTEAKKIDPAELEAKFKGKAEYNAKSGQLTIVYDFKNDGQLEDFIHSEDSTTKIVGGKAMLGGKDSMKHNVEFRKVKVTADFTPKRFEGTQSLFWLNAPGRLECERDKQGKQIVFRLFSDGEEPVNEEREVADLACDATQF